ncbi:lipoprotein [Desulfosarcina ovata subsp. ovata]|uniref:Lipoprotein n=1 Tax=Desulfosarcina ovata subsp. ovata TaxID=2752305 RepID=A0A5K8ACW4_9BACT|nr:lipoprotein [Desulfosarcina ovata subsp. ovata]
MLVDGAQIGGRAYVERSEAQDAFGFDIRGAGMLPVQVVIDNQGSSALEINPGQTFLEDAEGNLWPILTDTFAYERATKYAQTNKIFKEGAYGGVLGAAAGAVVGAAVGIVTGDNVGEAIGKGAAVGAAAGSVIGGTKGAASSSDARRAIINDLRDKSLENRSILPGNLAHGIIFFPGEATSAKQLRLQLRETDNGRLHTVFLSF